MVASGGTSGRRVRSFAALPGRVGRACEGSYMLVRDFYQYLKFGECKGGHAEVRPIVIEEESQIWTISGKHAAFVVI